MALKKCRRALFLVQIWLESACHFSSHLHILLHGYMYVIVAGWRADWVFVTLTLFWRPVVLVNEKMSENVIVSKNICDVSHLHLIVLWFVDCAVPCQDWCVAVSLSFFLWLTFVAVLFCFGGKQQYAKNLRFKHLVFVLGLSSYLSLTRIPVFGVCDQVRLRLACSATETS